MEENVGLKDVEPPTPPGAEMPVLVPLIGGLVSFPPKELEALVDMSY